MPVGVGVSCAGTSIGQAIAAETRNGSMNLMIKMKLDKDCWFLTKAGREPHIYIVDIWDIYIFIT